MSDREFWTALDRLVASAEVVIDRPAGSHHPRFDEIVYPRDYGYLDGTTAADGGGIDLWRGSASDLTVVGVIVTIDPLKRDAEIKVLVGCTEEDCAVIHAFHNETGAMRGLLIRRMVGDEGLEPPTSSV